MNGNRYLQALFLFFSGVLGSLLLITVFSSLRVVRAQEDNSTGPHVDNLPAQIREAYTQARAKAGLPPLALNPQLMDAAREQAQFMAKRQELSHNGLGGFTPDQRVVQHGYQYQQVGENIAAGQQTVQEVMQSWMSSPPHRHNILGNFTEMGAARVMGANGVPYWCVVFGRPLHEPTAQHAGSR